MKKFKKLLADIQSVTIQDDLDAIEQNITKFSRIVSLVAIPHDISGLEKIVEIANKTRTPIYPYSTGKNWGFGSKLPVENESVLVDLSRLNRILEVNHDMGYAVIEPGVTQRQLAQLLKESHSSYYIDVTGSGADTSIIGNGIDRGIAYNSLRVETLSNLKVLLGSGETIQTGFATHFEEPLAHLYKYGVGPGLDQLFFQSNYGIVTAATIQLHRRKESRVDFRLIFNDDRLEEVTDKLAGLKKEGLLPAIARTGDRSRSYDTMAPLLKKEYLKIGRNLSPKEIKEKYNKLNKTDWSSFGKIEGRKSEVKLKKRLIKQTFKGSAKISFFSDFQYRTLMKITKKFRLWDLYCSLSAGDKIRGLVEGEPSNAALEGASWQQNESHEYLGNDLDSSRIGFTLIVPLCTLDGPTVRKMTVVCREVAQNYDVDLAMTLNAITAQVLEGVISIKFLSPSEGEKCMIAMNQALIKEGYLPYRLNIANMDLLVDQQNPFWKYAAKIKKVLDPNGIISPKRYSLL